MDRRLELPLYARENVAHVWWWIQQRAASRFSASTASRAVKTKWYGSSRSTRLNWSWVRCGRDPCRVGTNVRLTIPTRGVDVLSDRARPSKAPRPAAKIQEQSTS
ncbi:MAG TPA: hypothetical protein VFU02_01405 [Polyangiaceae bacterium]|nr:hypothetical protein [Polyangiaceae bacterium]